MTITVLKTEGGPHSPMQWAQTTASKIITIAETADPTKAAAARKLEGELITILEEGHAKVQADGRSHHEKYGAHIPLMQPKIDGRNKTFKAILDAGAKSPFADHFAKPETQEYIKAVLQQHYATALDIERQWAKLRSN